MAKRSLPNAIIFYWLPPILWALVIFTFSSFPTSQATQIDWQDFIIKKTAHIVVYAVLTVLTYRALIVTGIAPRKALMISIVTAIMYGVSDEYHQSFTPGRDPQARDVAFDTIGSLFAIYTIWNILPRAPKRLRSLAESLELV